MLKNIHIHPDKSIYSSKETPDIHELVKTRIMNIDTNKQIVRLDDRSVFSKTSLLEYKRYCFYRYLYSREKQPFKAIIISDYNKGVVDEELIKELEAVNIPVFIDTKKKDLSIFKNIKDCYIKINKKEYENSINSNTIKKLIVTEGKNGASQYTEGVYVSSFKTFEVENADVIGARRCFFSGLCFGNNKKTINRRCYESAVV